jgi:hypothetical protein
MDYRVFGQTVKMRIQTGNCVGGEKGFDLRVKKRTDHAGQQSNVFATVVKAVIKMMES